MGTGATDESSNPVRGCAHFTRAPGCVGLAIVRHLVRAYGGTVTAESESDVGSAVTVRLPKADPGGVAEEG